MPATEPVLVMAFNRPDLLEIVFARLREVRPSRVFLAVDGPRIDRPGERALVEASRDLASMLDWGCEVRTLFQDTNLGCGRGVSTALSWFFEQVDRGIVLEDDVLPDATFFEFCGSLLDRYQTDSRVFAVSGCNVVPRSKLARPQDPYRFSQIPVVWGWATWRRSWAQHRLDVSGWRRRLPISRLIKRVGYSPTSALFWGSEFELTARGNVDTWDWQLTQAAMISGQLTATSNVNLVENLGFGAGATHTKSGTSRLAEPQPVTFPLGPVPIAVDWGADRWATRHHFGGSMLTSLDRLRQYAASPRMPVAPWL